MKIIHQFLNTLDRSKTKCLVLVLVSYLDASQLWQIAIKPSYNLDPRMVPTWSQINKRTGVMLYNKTKPGTMCIAYNKIQAVNVEYYIVPLYYQIIYSAFRFVWFSTEKLYDVSLVSYFDGCRYFIYNIVSDTYRIAILVYVSVSCGKLLYCCILIYRI